VPGITNAVGVAADEYFSCAVLSDGHIDCWGSNVYAELGNGTTTTSLTPVQVHGITNAGRGSRRAARRLVPATDSCAGEQGVTIALATVGSIL
jgi:hypothetical protein